MTESQLQQVLETIKDFHFDIRAEVLVADLLENGLNLDEIEVALQGALKRPYRKDLLKATYDEIWERVRLELSRNGLYDALPEGVFHQSFLDNKQQANVSLITKEYKRHKSEERDARLFFKPIENEFFTQKVFLELKERSILYKLHYLFNDFLLEFWKIDRSLPKLFTEKLINLLPIAHRIAGDLDLVASCLEMILATPVSIKSVVREKKEYLHPKAMNENVIGIDFIMGQQVKDYYPELDVTIGPVPNLTDYLKNGTHHKFLQTFFGFFLPVEYEVNTEVLVEASSEVKEKSYGRLGYTATI